MVTSSVDVRIDGPEQVIVHVVPSADVRVIEAVIIIVEVSAVAVGVAEAIVRIAGLRVIAVRCDVGIRNGHFPEQT